MVPRFCDGAVMTATKFVATGIVIHVDTVELGKTGLQISVAGLGCGGASRLGQRLGASTEESIQIVREALDLGITYFDTAQAYGTEEIVGHALKGHRDEVVISTKANIVRTDSRSEQAKSIRSAVEASLVKLQTETIDVFHLHGIADDDYDYCVSEVLPELLSLRDQGVIRYIAISELFGKDSTHEMLQRAKFDDFWDVFMVGFNLLNPSARLTVLPETMSNNIGVEVMFAVRRAISRPEVLRKMIVDASAEGLLDASALDLEDPLGFLVHNAGASSVVEAAYRFARHEPGCDVVLTGTGNREHLRENVRSINLPTLPETDLERLRSLFGQLTICTGN